MNVLSFAEEIASYVYRVRGGVAMFANSTHRKHWIFSNADELLTLRRTAQTAFLDSVSIDEEEKGKAAPLTLKEEQRLTQYYVIKLRDVAAAFQPPAPWSVVGTATVYLKRFFLRSTAMEHPVKMIMYTCLYLACKIEEFNLSVDQFLMAVPAEEQHTVRQFVLQNELMLVQSLHFHLTVHNPYRPLEGFLVDMKTRCPVSKGSKIRKIADQFLVHVLSSDAPLLYIPSQIALCAIVLGARTMKVSLDKYLNETLGAGQDDTKIAAMKASLQRIESTVATAEPNGISKEAAAELETRCQFYQDKFVSVHGGRKRRYSGDSDDELPMKILAV
ncbi:cyclin-H-like [Sycon ciliatum]|uniref:cyclin-H-like n=1 Tax=Sycon ciliatum TaxID=27933 RepID=UPI0031F699DE